MRTFLLLGVAASFGLAGVAAAAPVTTVFTIKASGFSNVLSDTVAPVDPVTLRFSLTFDPATGDQFDNTTGLTLLSSSVPVAGKLAFDYNSAFDALTVGGAGLSTEITAGTNDVLAEITTAYKGTPSFGGLEYATAATSGIYLSLTGTVAAVATPEPGTITLVLAGLTALGLRRRR